MEPFQLANPPLRHYRHFAWDSARWQGFEPRKDDILVCTPYKAGTTWTQMICALLIFQETSFYRPLAEISPWMDLRSVPVEQIHALYAAETHRRFIKTHTPLDGLPWYPDATYICVARDPRDVFVSMMNHMANANPDADAIFVREMRESGDPRPEIPEEPNALFRYWLSNGSFAWERDGAPYWSVFNHGESFWAHRDEPNVILLHYSDMKADLEGQMRRVAAALKIEVAESKWPELVAAASFESMKKAADTLAPDTNYKMWKDNSRFFHKGTTGQWRDLLSPESLSFFDQALEHYPPDYTEWLLNGSGGEGSA